MKTQFQLLMAFCVVVALTQPVRVMGADNIPPDKATPGTPASTDSKTQQNNPAGSATQTTAHPKEGTKKHKHKTHAAVPGGVDQSGDKATKTPQKDAPPSTTTGSSNAASGTMPSQ